MIAFIAFIVENDEDKDEEESLLRLDADLNPVSIIILSFAIIQKWGDGTLVQLFHFGEKSI